MEDYKYRITSNFPAATWGLKMNPNGGAWSWEIEKAWDLTAWFEFHLKQPLAYVSQVQDKAEFTLDGLYESTLMEQLFSEDWAKLREKKPHTQRRTWHSNLDKNELAVTPGSKDKEKK